MKSKLELEDEIEKLSQKIVEKNRESFPGGTVVKNPPANAGDTGQALVQ